MTEVNTKTLVRFWQKHHGLTVDGIAGPKTLASIAVIRAFDGPLTFTEAGSSPFMERIVDYALADEGRGEQGGNNRGPYVRGIREYAGFPVKRTGAWCAIFASAKIRRAWMSFEYPPMSSRARIDLLQPVLSRGAKELVRNVKNSPTGRIIEVPEPGFALYRRGIGWQGHIRIIVSYDIERDAMKYVAGNENGVVRVRTLSHGAWRKGLIEMVTL